ncbi:peptidyl-prolyl cis-trans isomerase [Rubrivirga sp.]|uniref:peptidyl-prolyl cis-trans isomerase n=1 Tax=Rubrivirga sp. TaxID=1885344 RepID=UPI003B525300
MTRWLLLLAVLAAGCGPDAEPAVPAPAGVVAEVAGEPIRAEDFERTYIDRLLRTGEPDTEAGRWAHLDRLIAEALLAQEARARGLDADPAVRQSLAARRDQALASAYYDHAFLASLPTPTEAEIRSAYARDAAKASVRHALFQTEDEAAAAYAQVVAGRPFAEVAAQAFGVGADSAGVLGEVGYFEIDDAVAEAAFGQNPGSVSRPVRSPYGWHLVQTLDVVTAPLLTADGLDARREGLTNQVAQRKRRLDGGAFVRSQMAALNVRVRPEAMRQFAQAVTGLEPVEAPTEGPGELRVQDARALSEALAPGTVLLTYAEGGQTRAFTAADAVRWLPTMPFAELMTRPAASVGRALRNEVFARRAQAAGLADDPFVQRETARAERQILTALMRRTLEAEAPDRAPADVTDRALDRLRARLARTTRVDGWAVPVASAAEGEAVRDAGADPAARPGYRALDGLAVAQAQNLRDALRRAPVGQTVVTGLPDGAWAVVHVARRSDDGVRITAAQRDSVARRLAPRVPELALLPALRQRAEVRVDSSAFRALMRAARRASA